MTWERWAVFGAVLLAALVIARIIDRRLAKRRLPPEAETAYRVLRRSVMAAIIAIGLFSALLAIPAVRSVAGAVLGSAAIIGLIAGLAAQSTLSNFVAGLLIAFTQPVRIGDRVAVEGGAGVVEEIGLMYTLVRLDDRSRLVIPNSKLASDTIRNATIVSREKVAEITIQLPLGVALGSAVDLLRAETAGERDAEVFVSRLEDSATLTVRALAQDDDAARRLERDLRLRAHERLRTEGVLA
ncbi:MAG TPA: mechanosensitive ion channel domain-containing protein [Gaiellaceae bacterium]